MSTTSAELLSQLSEGADSETDSGAAADESGRPSAGGTGDAGSESADTAGTAERQDSGVDGRGHSGDAEDKPAAVKPTADQIEQNHLAALREARGEIKAMRARIQEFEAQPKLSAEGQAALAKLLATEQATQEQEPDFLADPKGYVDAKVAAALKKLDEANKEATKTTQKITQKEEVDAVFRATANQEAAFVQTQPDYPQALQHIRTVRTQQLNMMFPDATPEQVSQHIAFEEMQTARALISQNKNPAEFAYSYAKTMGYQVKAPAAKQPAKSIDKSAARTMGSGGGDGAPEAEDDGAMPAEFGQALQERFKRK